MGINRYKEKKQKPDRNRFFRLRFLIKIFIAMAGVMTLSVVFIFVYELFTQSAFFNADTIALRGLNRLSPEQVLVQADIPNNVNILTVNLSVVRKKLRAHPWISEAGVKRELPSGLVITINEHTPLAIVDIGRKFLINTDWEVFKEFTPADPNILPVIKGLRVTDLRASGQQKSKQLKAVMTVLKLGKSPACIIPISAIKSIIVDKEMGLTVFAFQRIPAIKLGYENYAEKYERLRNVMFYLNESKMFTHIDHIQWIDLSNPERIVINPQQASTATAEREV